MKEPYREGVANHPGPESCVVNCKVGHEALTGVQVGWGLSREMELLWGANAVRQSGKATWWKPLGREAPPPCAVREPRHAWNLYAREPGGPGGARCYSRSGPEGEGEKL